MRLCAWVSLLAEGLHVSTVIERRGASAHEWPGNVLGLNIWGGEAGPFPNWLLPLVFPSPSPPPSRALLFPSHSFHALSLQLGPLNTASGVWGAL